MRTRNYKTKKDYSKPKAYRKWDLWEEDDFFVGKYKEYGESEYKKKMFPNWTFEVIECNFNTVDKNGKERKILPGELLQLNSVGAMQRPMEEAVVDETVVMIEYFGKKEVPIDGEFVECHTMKVQHVELDEEEESEDNNGQDL